jgi:luciferase family oxidoreductase group 1
MQWPERRHEVQWPGRFPEMQRKDRPAAMSRRRGRTVSAPIVGPPFDDLSALPRRRLAAMRAATRDLFEVLGAFAQKGGHPVRDLLGDAFAAFEPCPSEPVLDEQTGCSWFYHAHDNGGGRPWDEHGHFHCFVDTRRLPAQAKPLALPAEADLAAGGTVHLPAIAIDARGVPTALFVPNRWVTGEWLYPAAEVAPLAAGFALGADSQFALTSRWLSAMFRLFEPQIAWLLHERDTALDEARRADPDCADGEALEVLAFTPIDVDTHIAALDRAWRRKRASPKRVPFAGRLPPLSILDVSPVTTGTPGAAALRNSVDLAQLADRLGYRRYWVGEHHNAGFVAGTAPDIMIGRIASVTARIRVGSGGVMLNNHQPLIVAERFKVLEALHPGRIDLGLGRSNGCDAATARALTGAFEPEAYDFSQRVEDLLLLAHGGFPDGHPLHGIEAMPADARLPPVFLLGSTDHSARLAGHFGTGFAFAHYLASHDAVAATAAYRAAFRPSAWRDKPHLILAVAAVCATSEAEAERLAATIDHHLLQRSKGESGPLLSAQQAASQTCSAADRARIALNRSRLFVGTKEGVAQRLLKLAEETEADELMISTMIFDHAARCRSYELLAEAFALPSILGVLPERLLQSAA